MARKTLYNLTCYGSDASDGKVNENQRTLRDAD